MKKPLFSIIIPTLNEEKYLPKLLHSLEKQSYKDFEVIICDGSSSDKTVEVAKKFEGKLPRFKLYSKLKRNVSYQRNFGAKNACGQYLQFIDADATVPPNFFKQMYKNISGKNVSVATTWLVPDSKHPADEVLINLVNLIIEASRFLDLPLAPGFNLLFKKEVFFKLGGFPEKVVHAEDHEIVKKAQAKGYFMTVFREPKLTASLRRLRREGRLTNIRKFAQATFYILLKGPITKEIFDYQMGGGSYHQNRGKIAKQNNILKALKNLSENGRKTVYKTIQEFLEI